MTENTKYFNDVSIGILAIIVGFLSPVFMYPIGFYIALFLIGGGLYAIIRAKTKIVYKILLTGITILIGIYYFEILAFLLL